MRCPYIMLLILPHKDAPFEPVPEHIKSYDVTEDIDMLEFATRESIAGYVDSCGYYQYCPDKPEDIHLTSEVPKVILMAEVCKHACMQNIHKFEQKHYSGWKVLHWSSFPLCYQ